MATDLPGLARLHVAPEANPDDLMCLPVRTVRELTTVAAQADRLTLARDDGRCDECEALLSDTGHCDCGMGDLRATLTPFRGGA